ncbi:MAG TPA: response regulator [Chitinophagaceae bacterium]
MSTLKIGIVEDEIIIADHIAEILVKLGYEVIEPVDSYAEAIQMIEEEMPDLLLLDIQLKGKRDGIDLAAKIKDDYHIPFIFLTANADAATVERAKNVNPSSYLIKPFTKDDLYTAIEICMHNFSATTPAKVSNAPNNFIVNNSLFIKEGQHFNKVKFSDILYLESEHVYVKVHTADKTFLVRNSLQKYLENFNDRNFFRIHRSYAINLEHIQSVNSEYVIINGVTLPVGKSYKDLLLDRLNLK